MIKYLSSSSTDYHRILSNLHCQTTFDNLEKCDIIIETVFEDLRFKQIVLDKLEQYIPEYCIYASNTYVIPIHQIAAHSQRPEKVNPSQNKIKRKFYFI